MTKQVLVHSPEVNMSKLISIMLEQNDLTARPVNTEDSLMRMLDDLMPDLLILDLSPFNRADQMLYSRVRSHPHASRIPLLLLVHGHEIDVARSQFEQEPIGFLTKPVLHYDLAQKVRSLLGTQPDPAAGSSANRSNGNEVSD
jgi:DNA-binding NtrC family response regulator